MWISGSIWGERPKKKEVSDGSNEVDKAGDRRETSEESKEVDKNLSVVVEGKDICTTPRDTADTN
jgi:hypothetical protein